MVTVYSKPGCVGCNATKSKLARLGKEYVEVDISSDPEGLEIVRSLGYQQVPVVVAGDIHWSGYSPDKLAALI